MYRQNDKNSRCTQAMDKVELYNNNDNYSMIAYSENSKDVERSLLHLTRVFSMMLSIKLKF